MRKVRSNLDDIIMSLHIGHKERFQGEPVGVLINSHWSGGEALLPVEKMEGYLAEAEGGQ